MFVLCCCDPFTDHILLNLFMIIIVLLDFVSIKPDAGLVCMQVIFVDFLPECVQDFGTLLIQIDLQQVQQ